MRWDDQHSSPDLIDRRGDRGGGGLPMGLLYLLPWLLRSPLGWFEAGYRTGRMADCDTFGASEL